MEWTRGDNADGQIWDFFEVELEGVAVRLVVGVEGEKGNLGDSRFGLTNWVNDGGKDKWRNGFLWRKEIMSFWSKSVI